MKPFFSSVDPSELVFEPTAVAAVVPSASAAVEAGIPTLLHGRIAVYDSPAAAPRIEDVVGSSPDSFIEELAARTYSAARDLGGKLPYTVIREVVENLIHARFEEPVVSVLAGGDTVRFSDQGPGIPDKE